MIKSHLPFTLGILSDGNGVSATGSNNNRGSGGGDKHCQAKVCNEAATKQNILTNYCEADFGKLSTHTMMCPTIFKYIASSSDCFFFVSDFIRQVNTSFSY